MPKIARRFLLAASVSGLLFFGAGLSSAAAVPRGFGGARSHGRFAGPGERFHGRSGRFFPHARFHRFDRGFGFGHFRSFGRPFYGRSFSPFRRVRVLIYDPFPRFVWRVVADPYCYPY